MGRRSLAAVILVAVAVLLAFSWFGWGREGLTPVPAASPNAAGINQLYAFIGFFAVAIFLSVMIPLALILGRYRERGLPREAEGPQVRGNTRLELLWTITPTIIVLIISAFTLYKAPQIVDAKPAAGAAAEPVRIAVEGRQFYWRYVYENRAVAIDTLRVPVDRVIDLDITAPGHDVVHSFWVPTLMGKLDAIPGNHNHLEFRPTRVGVFDGRCGELCGIQHTQMNFQVEVLREDEFERWLDETAAAQAAGRSDLGKTLWEGACAKCHLGAPEYAPNLIGNPLLADEKAIRQTVTLGRGQMPAVGRGWSDREVRALTQYVKQFAPQEEESEDDGS